MIADNKTISDTEVMLGELDRIVSEEMKKKPSKRDDALIDECIAEMAKLKNVRAGYTDEEIGAIMEKIQAKASGTSKETPARRKSVRRSIAAACAACLVLVCGVATVAWSPFSSLKMWFIEIVQEPLGTTLDIEHITYTNQGKTLEYNNIEELLKDENLNVLYPSILPENTHITGIELISNDNVEYLNVYFNDSSLHFIIQFNMSLYVNSKDYETVVTKYTKFYIYPQNDHYIAQGYLDSNLYIIESNNYQDIILLINNLKKGYIS